MHRKLFWLGLGLFLVGGWSAVHAQSEGVSRPPQDVPQASEEPQIEVITPPQPMAKPSPAMPVDSAPVAEAVPPPPPPPPPPLMAQPRPVPYSAAPNSDVSRDYGVLEMPHGPNELVTGTIVKVRMGEVVSSTFAQKGSEFHAAVFGNVMQDGRILIPSGSAIFGHVTVAQDHRMAAGRARLHLRMDEVILPDGRHLPLRARVIDTDQYKTLRVDSEGTILSRPDIVRGLGVTAGVAGVGAASGAVIGGPVGAVAGTVVGAGVGGGHMLMSTQEAILPLDSTVTLELTAPLNVAMN